MARAPAARRGSRRTDRQPDRLDSHLHAHPVRGLGRVLPLHPGPFPEIAESGGGLQGGHVEQVDLSRGCRGRGRSRSPDRIRNPAVGREDRRHTRRRTNRRSFRSPASSSRGTSTIPGPTGYSAARTSSCSTSSRTRWDSIAPILPRRTTSRRSISSICP